MTNEPKAGKGLDPEMLAAYIDNRLPPEQRASVEAQLANDPDSYAVLVETMKALDEGNVPDVRPAPVAEVSPTLASGGNSSLSTEAPSAKVEALPGATVLPMRPRGLKTRWVVAGSVLAVAAALAMVAWLQPEVWQRIRGGEPVDPLMAKLVEAVGEERYIEARLTGGFKYGPLRSVTRGPGDLSQQNLALLAAAGELQKTAQEDSSAANLHSWGVAQLLLGEYDGAARTLESAVAASPNESRLQNDLASGYLAAAKALDRPGDYPRALAAAERALIRDRRFAEAHFNRALALESLGLVAEAVQAWEEYLRVDESSPWAGEARQRLSALRERSPRADASAADVTQLSTAALDAQIRAMPEMVRRLIEVDLFADTGSVGARRQRRLDLARRFHAVTGDIFPLRLHEAAGQPAQPDANRVARAMSAYQDLRRNGEQGQYELVRRAAPGLQAELDRLIAPAGLHARYLYLWAESQTRVDDELVGSLRELAEQARALGYLDLAATALDRQGQIAGRLGDQTGAIRARLQAQSIYLATGERDRQASVASMIAESYRFTGDFAEAWKHNWVALRLLPEVTDLRTRHQVVVQSGLWCNEAGYPESGLYFFKAVAENAVRWNRPSAETAAFVQMAKSLQTLGQDEQARDALERATAVLPKVPDVTFRARTELEILELQATLGTIAQQQASVEAALRRAAEGGFEVRRSRLLIRKGAIQRTAGLARESDLAFHEAIRLLSIERASLKDYSARLVQARLIASVQSELAASALKRGAVSEAIARSDAAKTVTLSELLPATTQGTTDIVAEIRRSLTARQVMVYFIDGEDATRAIVVTKTGARSWTVSMGASELRDTVLAVGHALTTGATPEPLLDVLYRAVIAPAGIDPDIDAIVFVPDRRLTGLPVGALWDRAGGKYLVQRFDISVAPSADGFVRASRSMEARPAGARAVGFAATSSDAGLPALPMLAVERKALERLYAAKGVQIRVATSLAGVQQLLRETDIFHFAGHARAVRDQAGSMELVVTGREPGIGVSQLLHTGRAKTGIVMLAGCATIFEDRPTATVDSTFSLAVPLLAIGVPQVIGTLWPVTDRAAAELSTLVHQNLVAGMGAASALGRAQRSLIDRGSPLLDWSLFLAIGALA